MNGYLSSAPRKGYPICGRKNRSYLTTGSVQTNKTKRKERSNPFGFYVETKCLHIYHRKRSYSCTSFRYIIRSLLGFLKILIQKITNIFIVIYLPSEFNLKPFLAEYDCSFLCFRSIPSICFGLFIPFDRHSNLV